MKLRDKLKSLKKLSLFKDVLKEPYPYEQSTFYFPENMQKLGYKVNGNDTIVDANAKVMLDMAKRIAALQEQVDILKDYSIAGFAHTPLEEEADDTGNR